MRTYYLIILSILILFSSSFLHAQNYKARIKSYNTSKGLSSRNISQIGQDREGFIWIATDNGLNRFDGYNFKTFFSDTLINSFEMSVSNELIIASNKGAFSLNTLSFNKSDIEDFEEGYLHITKLDSTKLLVATLLKAFVYDIERNEKKKIFDVTDFELYHQPFLTIKIFKAYVESENSIWFGNGNLGVKNIDSTGTIIKEYALYTEGDSFYQEPDKSRFWIQEPANGLIYKLQNDSSFKSFAFPKETKVYEMLVQPDGTYKSNFKGVEPTTGLENPRPVKVKGNEYFLFPRNSAEILIYNDSLQYLSKFIFENTEFNNLQKPFVDRNGILWFSNLDGLKSIKISEENISTYLNKSPVLDGNSARTRGVWEDKEGNVLFNTYSGLFKLDAKSNTVSLKNDFTVYLNITLNSGEVDTRKLNGFTGINLYDVLIEGNKAWFTADPFGMFSYDFESNTFNQYIHEGSWFHCFEIFKTSQGKLLVGAIGGLFFLDEKERRVVKSPLLDNSIIYDIEEIEGVLWVSTNKGLYQLNRDAEKIISKIDLVENQDQEHILDVHNDGEKLWIATNGLGLFSYDVISKEQNNYTINSHKLSDNRICSIIEENDSILWLGSFNGLMRFNENTAEISSFFTTDGLSDNEFNHGSAYKAKDGRMYFGGIKGINAFYPKELYKKKNQTQTLLSELRLFDASINDFRNVPVSEITGKTLKLAPEIDLFTVSFSLNDFTNSISNEYAYMLDDIGNRWQELGTQNQLTIPKPKPGQHTLKIRGKGSDGLWSENYLEIQFFVETPWYQQTWFYVSLTIILATSLFMVNFLRVKNLERAKQRLERQVKQRTREIATQKEQIEKQAEELQELDKVKSRFFTNISHELKTPLTLILGYTDYLKEETKSNSSDLLKKGLSATASNAKLLLKLIEEIMSLSKLEAGKLELSYSTVDLRKYLDEFTETFKPSLTQKQIRFSYNVNLEKSRYVVLDGSKVEKILLNLISNAIKFTPKGGEIVFSVTRKENGFEFIVKDAGRGIHANDLPHIFDRYYQSKQKDAPTEGGTGVGLALVKELIELMQGSVQVNSQLNVGSEFIVLLPLEVTQPVEVFNTEDEYLLSKSVATLSLNDDNIKTTISAKDKTLLLVEDNNQMREFIKTLLQDNYHIVEASDGEEGLNKIAEKHPDLIISDMMMPNMDGYEMLEHLKANEETQWIPTIMLTARSADEDKIKALQIGVNEYMLKPFNATELKIRVANMLQFAYERKQSAQLEKEENVMSIDEQFLNKIETEINNNIAKNDFNVEKLAKEVAMSSKTLTRKLKPLTGFTPLQFINEVRLQEARKMLERREKATVSEVMYAVGFQSGGHFSKAFFNRFGKTPKEYIEKVV